MSSAAPAIKPETIALHRDFSFESKVPIGNPAIIKYKKKKYQSFLRGILFTKYMLLDIPKDGLTPVLFDYNAMVVVNFTVSGMVFGIRAALLRTHPNTDILVLEYPSQAVKFNFRSSERVKVVVPVLARTQKMPESAKGAILDISKTGAQVGIDASADIREDETIALSLVLPEGKQAVKLVGQVHNLDEEGNKKYFGVSFESAGEETLRAVKKFYYECLAYTGQAPE